MKATKVDRFPMIIPEKVKIGIHEFEVELTEGIKGDSTNKITNKMGECFFDELILKVSKQYPPAKQHETFLHEIVHATLYEMEEDKLAGNEKFVSLLAKHLYILLTENDFFK